MSRKFIQVTFALLLLAGMILGFAIKDRVLANSPQAEPNGKIEGALVDKFAAEGTADFVVSFNEKADLSAAYTMDWNARGHYVYDTLTATANRVQADAIRSLKELGFSYKTFIAGNELYVYKGNLDAANAVAAISNVSNVRETRVYQLDPSIQTPAVKTVRWAGDLLANYAETTVAAPADFDWGITDTGAVDFWNTYGFKGEGIVVANIDTGVDYTHVALADNFKCAADPSNPECWLDPSSDCPGDTPCDAWPGVYHGTHTMGTMVGSDNPALLHQVGMAPNAQWIACLGCPFGGCPDLNLFACADWIVAPGGNPDARPDVVNNSWGGGGGNSWYLDAVNSWRAAGVFPAFSAGNNYSCNSLGSPGDYQESFASAAHRSDRVIADFSSKGPSVFGDSPYTKPNISAPGQDIMSAMPGDGWQLMSGTSMASPHTAGAVALLWSCNPSLKGNIDETFQVLQSNADTPPDGSCGAPGSGEGNYTYGYGYLDVNAAGLLTCGDVGYIEGYVTDIATGDPIEGATVVATAVPAGTGVNAITDPNGFYRIGLLVGTYDVTASAFGYLPETATGLVVTKDATLTQDFALEAAPADLVSGVVTDLDTGWPLYAKITITGFPGDPIWTNPETGAYSISLPEGILYTFNVDAFVSGYLTLSRDVGPLTGPTTEDFELAADPASCSAPGRHPDCFWFENFEGTDGGFTTGGTTTFAWGVPTSGPGEAHSGDYVWATNPAGQYNNNENGWVESPDIDLSDLAGQGVLFSWWQWLENESCCDHASILVSNDGGVTWATVYGPVQGQVDLTWTRHEVILDPSYAVSNFRVRFYFTTDLSVVYDGWYIDDLCIVPVPAPEEVYTQNFDADNGGFTTYGSLSTWAWGVPTSGPMSAHSAPNVWATNLAGNYNTYENSYIESPEIDLSAYAGSSIYIRWWQWLQTESCCDYGAVEVSNDGGVTWTVIYGPAYGDVNLSWAEKLAIADPSYAVSNFKMRFHLSTDVSIEYPGYYVDDISIAVGAGALIPCVADPGGMVVGNVYDGNTHVGLNGAAVLSDEGNGFITVATPTDPNVDDGFFSFFGTPGVHEVTASLKDYQPDTQDVTFIDGGTVLQDFNLGAGFLAVDPTSLHETLDFGDSIVDQLTLSNLGVSPLTFDIAEMDRGFDPALKIAIPRFEGTLPVDNRPVSAGPAPQTAGQSPVAPMAMPLAGEPAYAIDVYPGYNLVNIPDTTAPGTWNIVAGVPGSAYFAGDFINGDFSELYVIDYYTNLLSAIDTASGAATVIGPSIPNGGETWTGMTGATDGTMYASASACGAGSTLYTVDLATGAVTEVGPITNGTCMIDIAINAAGEMFGVDIVNDNLISIDPATGAGTIVGSLGVSANYAQGMDFEETTGILYWAAYTFSGELRIIDTTTGATTLVGGFPGGAEVDDLAFATGGATPNVSWLSEEPISGTIPAAPADQIVDVTFDASVVNQPGDYFADLRIKTDTPYGDVTVPVTMTVLAPATWGKLDGTVTDICTGQPIEEVTVDIAGGDPITRTFTDDMGYYWAWIEQGTYTVTYSIPSHISQSASVTVVAGQTTTHDVVLVPDRPCISIEPRIIEAWVLTDTETFPTDGFLISDPGAQDLTWELREKTGGYITSTLSIPRYEGAVIPDDRIQTNAQAPSRGEVKGGGLPLSVLLQDAPAFGNDAYPTGDLVTFDLATPGSFTTIANLFPGASDFLAGGDFLNGDFSTLYAVNYYGNNLLAIDTASGAMTIVGPAAPSGGETWSGMTASNDGTLYAVGTTCGSSTLYTIDPTTAAVTTVGPISNGGCMIDVAINPNGEMFGVDIISDNLIQIDPATGAGTVIGYTNFSANYAQGMDFDDETGILYWAAYGFSGELRVIDTTTGNSTSVGAFQNGAEIDGFGIATGGIPVDVPWVTEEPVSGTVPAGGSEQVDVTFTAQNPDGTPMPLGTYFATLNIKSNDAVAGTQSVSVIMHIVSEYLAPVPSFETNSPVNVGEEMVFTNTSDAGIPPTSEFVWDFGDGTSLTVENMDPVTHVYGTFGTFTVTLTACNIVDCGTATEDVVVLPKLILLPLINKN